jgi:hypothetical protein
MRHIIERTKQKYGVRYGLAVGFVRFLMNGNMIYAVLIANVNVPVYIICPAALAPGVYSSL